jgi:hypothetical protein
MYTFKPPYLLSRASVDLASPASYTQVRNAQEKGGAAAALSTDEIHRAGADIVVGRLRAAPCATHYNPTEMKCAYIPGGGTCAAPVVTVSSNEAPHILIQKSLTQQVSIVISPAG